MGKEVFTERDVSGVMSTTHPYYIYNVYSNERQTVRIVDGEPRFELHFIGSKVYGNYVSSRLAHWLRRQVKKGHTWLGVGRGK